MILEIGGSQLIAEGYFETRPKDQQDSWRKIAEDLQKLDLKRWTGDP